ALRRHRHAARRLPRIPRRHDHALGDRRRAGRIGGEEMSAAHDFRDTAALAPAPPVRPKLMTVDDAKRLEPKTVADLVTTHMNPGVLPFMELLGFHNVIVERAEGP